LSEPFEIKINALTPIWTGDADRKNSILRETGIIGSLRWWYEAVVRGLGGYACDPTSEKRCELSGKEKTQEERLAKLCPACYLFGCGGWKRRFRLEVQSSTSVPFQLATLDRKDKFNHWWLSQIFEDSIGTKLPFGNISLSFKQGNEDVINQVNALLSIMAHIGAIGAKNQYGFGQFNWDDKKDLEASINTIHKFLSDNNYKSHSEDYSNEDKWFSLANFWYYELSVPSDNGMTNKFKKANLIDNGKIPTGYLPVSFDIRYKMPSSGNGTGLRDAYYLFCRQSMSKEDAKQKTRSIFGTLENDRLGSRVFVSHLFRRRNTDNDYRLKVWGFTDDSVGQVVGDELKNIFRLDQVLSMITGKEILNTSGGGIR